MPQIDCEPGIAADIVESDARYFEMGVEVLPLPGCVLAWAPGLTNLAAGCVVQRIDTAAAEADPEAWLELVEQEVQRVGGRRARLYLREATPLLEGALQRSGYRRRKETVFVNPLSQGNLPSQRSGANQGVILREVLSPDDWKLKRAVHESEEEGADGYRNQAGQWVELIARKWRSGQKRCFLIQRGAELCGSIGILECGRGWRVKNVMVLPARQGQGIGLDALGEVARMAARAGKAYLGVLGIDGHAGSSLYKQAGYYAASALDEWTKNLKDEG